MNSYKLGKLYIENFKLFEKIDIDFTDFYLNIFDGPNGYGKSSIFDALEIVFTGRINRIYDFGKIHSSSPKDILFAKNINKSIKILVELIGDENVFLLAYLNPKNLKSADDKKAYNIKFDLYKINEFNQNLSDKDIEKLAKIEINDIEKVLNQFELAKFYSIKNYIQQFDPTSFLKKTETERMTYLSTLFGTDLEENKLNSYKQYKEEKQTEITRISALQKTSNDKLTELKTNYSETEYKAEYKQIFQDIDNQPFWDKQNIPISDKLKLEEIILDINYSIDLINKKEEFIKLHTIENGNNRFSEFCSNTMLLENTISYYNFIDNFNELQTKFSELKKIEDNKNYLRKINNQLNRESIENIPSLDIEKIESILGNIFTDNNPNLLLKKITEKRDSLGTAEDLILGIQNIRKSLVEKFSTYSKDHKHLPESECPLCGQNWQSRESLEKEFRVQEEKINKLQNTSTQELNLLLDELFNAYLIPLIKKIEEFIKKDEKERNYIDFFEQLNIDQKKKNQVHSLQEFLRQKNIDISTLCNNDFAKVEDVSRLAEKLRDFLQKQIVNIETEKEQIKYQALLQVYNNTFISSYDKLSEIKVDDLKKKIEYINYSYYSSLFQSITEIEKTIEKNKKEMDALTKSINDINEIITIYDEEIKKYWDNVLKQIELPFYIYSGKILQYHNAGLGIFINPEEREGKKSFIRFTPRNNTSIDALLSMSTGQLSALIITLMLALNRTYENKLNVLLIDDPVQTMDDMNIASLIEILRNDFSDKQIILSTHEDDVSMYFRFKFHGYGLKAQRINMKEKMLSL